MRVTALRLRDFKSFSETISVPLGQITIFIGRNNAGKSALLRAIYGMQSPIQDDHVRIGADVARVALDLEDIDPSLLGIPSEVPRDYGHLTLSKQRGERQVLTAIFGNEAITIEQDTTPSTEPRNFLYPFLARRKAAYYTEKVDIESTNAVRPDLSNLGAKVARLSSLAHPRHEMYVQACRSVLGLVPSVVASANGQKVGLAAGTFDSIPIEELGEGVANALGLIVQLCVAKGRLILVEEPENDIHPEALKALLDLILESSKTNQFVMSTHSHIVMKHLGSHPDTRIYAVDMNDHTPLPTSTVRLLDTPRDRLQALESLGYDIFDFGLPEGFLVLEEASAERLVQEYLIPWFAPWLGRLRTISAGGVSKVEPTFEDFHRLFLFAHLQDHYAGRAWVIVDSDSAGQAAVERLRERFSNWEQSHFLTWGAPHFEHYYPELFGEQVDEVLALKDRQARRERKRDLLQQVLAWIETDRDVAKLAFEASAAPVIDVLREIEQALLSRRTMTDPTASEN